jgi:hypothetical protein
MLRSFSFPARALSVLFVALTVFLVFGSDLVGPALAQQQTTKPTTAAAAVFNFTVKITYSQKAMDTLVAGKETVIVAGYLMASPIPGTPKKYVDHVGQIGLGEVDREIAPGAIATFRNVRPTQAMMKWVDSQGPQLLINVYSGRKSSPNNLLDCGIYQGSLAAVQG